MVRSISIAVAYDDLSVSGTIGTAEWDAELAAALASRCVAALVDAYEVMTHTSHRLGAELG